MSDGDSQAGGEICCWCNKRLDPPERRGKLACADCQEQREPRRRIYMAYMLSNNWHCQFLEEDLKTPLPRKVTFDNSDKLIEMVERGGRIPNLEADQMLRYGIQLGRGGMWLSLTVEQYQKLKKR